ncbi:MAG: hypothetical protein MJ016_02595 [Victivallaceae bacterium]|nr:hypothetical protein [Victivallaceae bacterium]
MNFLATYAAPYPAEVARLCRARNAGRFGHSFLIRCDDPEIRREFAVVLAQIGGCPRPRDGAPDLSCPYCRKLEENVYPEWHSLTPCGKMYQIRVGESDNPEPNTMRSFLHALSLTGSEVFPVKIGVIEDADRLNSQAQNALLKTLEEPPRSTLIMLLTANVSALLPTTRSRCRLISLPTARRALAFAEELFGVLSRLVAHRDGDLGAAEEAAETLVAIFGRLAEEADAQSEADFAAQMQTAKQLDDPVFVKNLEERRQYAAAGIYMRRRGHMLAALHTFAAECYMLGNGIAFADLPHPEAFTEGPVAMDLARGKKILAEAETLLATLRFNVPEELALRTFAVNVAMPENPAPPIAKAAFRR